jgi:hypothetical protein
VGSGKGKKGGMGGREKKGWKGKDEKVIERRWIGIV